MLQQAFRVQVRVIHALIFRELRTRFGREQLGYVWALVEPMLFVMVLTFVYSIGFRGKALSMPIVLFLVTGVIPFFLYRQALNRSIGAILSNRPLLTFPQVTPLDLVVGRATLETITMFLVFVVVSVGYAVFGDTPLRIENPLGVVFVFICIAIMGFGFGSFLGAFSVMFPTIERLMPALVVRPLFYTSGVFFTADMMPDVVRSYLLINPLLHATEILRSSFFVEFDSEYGEPGYLMAWVLGNCFSGCSPNGP